MIRRILPFGLLVLAGLAALVVWLRAPIPSCQAQSTCPEPAATGRQPLPGELKPLFDLAGKNLLGSSGPVIGQINKGYPNPVKVSPYVPCILMYAIGYTESAWQQFDSGWGQTGDTVVSGDCGYGIMQITSGMNGTGLFDPQRVAAEPAYNLGTGAQELVRKWNNSPFIGQNDPLIVEEWYFATWAYNGWGWVNNPNNSVRFNVDRPPYDGTQPRADYPYQEIVWGFASHPPKYASTPLWNAAPLTLPARALMSTPAPTWIARPLPYHTSCPTGTDVATRIPTSTRTATATRTATRTSTATATSTATRTPTASATRTPTTTATRTATSTATKTSTHTPRPTRTVPAPDLFFPLILNGGSSQ